MSRARWTAQLPVLPFEKKTSLGCSSFLLSFFFIFSYFISFLFFFFSFDEKRGTKKTERERERGNANERKVKERVTKKKSGCDFNKTSENGRGKERERKRERSAGTLVRDPPFRGHRTSELSLNGVAEREPPSNYPVHEIACDSVPRV